METVFAFLKYSVMGFFGLLVLLFILAIIFGKRVKKLWELEAEFRDAAGREFGEFDIEMSRIEKEEPDYTFKAKFRMRHASLASGAKVQVLVDEVLIMDGVVEKEGRIWLDKGAIRNTLSDATAGQVCHVLIDGVVAFSEALVPD